MINISPNWLGNHLISRQKINWNDFHTQVIQFITHVRNRDVKNVALHNKTNQVWTLRPVIDGEYWSGADTFIIEPQQSKNYELVYRPLMMTQDNKKHNVSEMYAYCDQLVYFLFQWFLDILQSIIQSLLRVSLLNELFH